MTGQQIVIGKIQCNYEDQREPSDIFRLWVRVLKGGEYLMETAIFHFRYLTSEACAIEMISQLRQLKEL